MSNGTFTNISSALNIIPGTSIDVTDNISFVNSSRNNEVIDDMPLDHRLPSPEEQCQMIALK